MNPVKAFPVEALESVWARTKYQFALPPFVIHIFEPEMDQELPYICVNLIVFGREV